MPKVRIQATKMSDARVDFISLVARPANRSPIKIAKQEQQEPSMKLRNAFDLSGLFTQKSEAQAPVVVGVATMKDDNFDAVKKQVEEAGFAVDQLVELEDQSVVFKQAEVADGDEGVAIRLNDNVAVVAKGFRPYNMDMDVGESSFKDMAAAQGFYPSVGTVLDVVRSSIYSVVEKAASPDEAATAVAKMFDEAKQYATTMVSGLPSKAFKLESSHAVEAPFDPAAFDFDSFELVYKGMSPEMKAKMKAMVDADGDTDNSKPGEPAKKAEGEGAAAAKSAEPVQKSAEGAITMDAVSKLIADSLAAATTELAKKMEAMVGGVTETVTKSVAELTEKVTKADAKAEEVSQLLSGKTVRGADGGDVVFQSARKSERSVGGGEIDTAYLPRNQRGLRRQ